MEQREFTIQLNKKIAADTFRLELNGDTSAILRPGQFVDIQLPGFYLRRPLSVCDREEGKLTLIYKVVGQGTDFLSGLTSGKLDLLVGLGNGYDTKKSGAKPLLAGGGAGVPPLYLLAKELIKEGKEITAVLGFNRADEVFLLEEFRALGVRMLLATVDGSAGIKGFVTDAMQEAGEYTYFYACGPEPMLKAVSETAPTGGQLSFEARMGCGFGACMGCSCETKYGAKRICKDGPVLEKEEVLW